MKDNQTFFIKGNFIYNERLKQSILKNTVSRYFLYFIQSIIYKILIFINRIFFRPNKVFNYKISICGIFKNESKFLDEWIRYHLVVGVDHFYLYNNNSNDTFLNVLQPYIDKGVVDLIDWPYNHSQMKAYEDCYNKHKNHTNWLAFIDIDEFICPISKNNLKSWICDFNHYPGVAVYWKNFGSNGKLVHDDEQFVIEQYSQCWPKPSTFTKMFCNMNFSIEKFDHMHIINSIVFGIVVPPINQFKNFIKFGINRTTISNKSTIQLNHYWGKSFDTFIENKVKRTDAHQNNDAKMAEIRLSLLKPHENMCTTRDYNIQRFLLDTKLLNIQEK
jgi:hypothetical protein